MKGMPKQYFNHDYYNAIFISFNKKILHYYYDRFFDDLLLIKFKKTVSVVPTCLSVCFY